ncbi:GAS1 [Lepeophtheirus salmonis]|uniref:GAS1 n=1 Tax=Lepeophtheirus salmonis TaxID=72036 RepID=A0A7R8CVI7_LEPSM|nr:GAS1 [Lepeophtheirus salmonis]CAF2912513.1 GAS1 [Lepeophtheirus salmonis]
MSYCHWTSCLYDILNSPKVDLVAQSWSTEDDDTNADSNLESCRFLSLKCSYRGGCGATLRSYLLECNDLIQNKTEICSESCKYTLIGLTSTPEGKSMLDCDCGTDEECFNSRYRLEICSKDSVLYANRQDTVVSCTEAKWICMSDSECSKALEYYNIFCKSMFRGNKCTNRCRNSINILKKQNKAAKLETCFCDNDEILGYKCSDIKRNMKELCLFEDTDVSSSFGGEEQETNPQEKTNEEHIDDEEDKKLEEKDGGETDVVSATTESIFGEEDLISNVIPDESSDHDKPKN